MTTAAASTPFIGTCGGSLKDVPANAFDVAVISEAGGASIYQIVASKRDGGAWPVRLTRRDLYRG